MAVIAAALSCALAVLATPAMALSSYYTCTTNSTTNVTTCSYTLPANPATGAMSALGNNVIGWVTTSGVPILLALVALGIVLHLIIRLVKRGARAV